MNLPNMNAASSNKKTFYLVLPTLQYDRSEHHLYGYETENAFSTAINNLFLQWRNHVGECIDRRFGFLRLRFCNCYGGHEDVWLPKFMVRQTAPPEESPVQDDEEAEIEKTLDKVFGFD